MGGERIVSGASGRVIEHVGGGDAADVPGEAALGGAVGGGAHETEIGGGRELPRPNTSRFMALSVLAVAAMTMSRSAILSERPPQVPTRISVRDAVVVDQLVDVDGERRLAHAGRLHAHRLAVVAAGVAECVAHGVDAGGRRSGTSRRSTSPAAGRPAGAPPRRSRPSRLRCAASPSLPPRLTPGHFPSHDSGPERTRRHGQVHHSDSRRGAAQHDQRRHRHDHPQGLPEDDPPDRPRQGAVRGASLQRRRQRQPGLRPQQARLPAGQDPGRRRQLRLRVEPRARAVGAARPWHPLA